MGEEPTVDASGDHTCLPIGEGPSRSIRVDGQQRDWHKERQGPFSFAKRMLKSSQHSTKSQSPFLVQGTCSWGSWVELCPPISAVKLCANKTLLWIRNYNYAGSWICWHGSRHKVSARPSPIKTLLAGVPQNQVCCHGKLDMPCQCEYSRSQAKNQDQLKVLQKKRDKCCLRGFMFRPCITVQDYTCKKWSKFQVHGVSLFGPVLK